METPDVTANAFRLKGLVEKPSPQVSPSCLAVLSRYILPSGVIGFLEQTQSGIGGEIQLTDALDELLKIDGLNAFESDAGIFDCGNKQGFLSGNLTVGLRDPDTNRSIKALIKKRIDSLIERDYLEKDKDDENQIIYKA